MRTPDPTRTKDKCRCHASAGHFVHFLRISTAPECRHCPTDLRSVHISKKNAVALSAYFGGFADKARRSAFEGRADTEAGISATPAVWRLVGLPMAQTIAVHDSVCGVSQVAFGRSSA